MRSRIGLARNSSEATGDLWRSTKASTFHKVLPSDLCRTHLNETSQKKPFLMVRPVSYTHLRAHETRHDIVCRLLLEKKKKKIKNKTKKYHSKNRNQSRRNKKILL